MERRDHERLAIGDEAEVRDEPGVENGVDRRTVVPAALGIANRALPSRPITMFSGKRSALSSGERRPVRKV
jgi:hypothetical protein